MAGRSVDVSILVLTYNHAPYIAECLDHLLGQDYTGTVEILVGEDCSTDETAAIVARYANAHPEIQVISSHANVGMFRNHRRLLAASKGTFVAYCEGDDYWHEASKLRQQVAYLDRHPQCSGVCSDVDHVTPRGSGWARLPSYWSSFLGAQAPRTTFRDLLVRNTVQTCSVLLRGDLARSFLGSRLSEVNYSVDDWPLFLHVAVHAPLGRMPESLATYRRVAGSATNSGLASNERRLMDQFRLIDDASRLVADAGTAREAGMEVTMEALVNGAVVSGNRDMLLRAIQAGEAWGVSPTSRARRWKALLAVPFVAGLTRNSYRLRQRAAERVRYR